ncbi:hypothetical protein EV178_002335 [Coemansia sp. RSA 1646]|nr:hypothetical protein EV178_002335 [Coemansia sp. RSA 1646]
MGDHINVAIRIRPLNQRELRSSVHGAQGLLPWAVQRDTITQRSYSDGRVSNGNSFTFDRVFDQKESTLSVYDDVVKQIITSSMDGFNGTIFAYGQTSSGKTHTMHGSNTELGIIKLAVNEMFRIVECDPDREYLIRVSFLEIYNEVLRDLLEPTKSNLKIHENAKREIFVGDLSEHIVFNVQQVEEVLQKGDRNRHIAGTNMNERSSRSHTIFRIVIESREKADAEGEDSTEGTEQAQKTKRQQRLSTGSTDDSAEFTGAVKVSCLNLVDLAGSERVGQTGAEGQRLKEGAHINKSLMTLGTVIARLSEDGGDKGHIPYRDSKLTRILQPSIGGNAKTLIICTITPSPDYVDEALSTLKFASRAKTIQNKPEVNEELRGDALLRRLKRASELEKEVAQMKDIERKKLKIEADNEQLLRQLWKSQKERERLQRELNVQQTSMFFPKNADGKSNIDAVPSFRRQTWFSGLQKPFADGESGISGTSAVIYSPAGLIDKSAEAMDTDDDDTPRHSIDGRRRCSDNGSNRPCSDAVTLGPEFNQLVADKIGDLEASNDQLRQQHDDLARTNKDMEGTIQRVMREYNLLLKTLSQLAITDTIPPSPAKPSPTSTQQQQPHELVQIRRKLRALMTTIDASQRQCQKFRSQRPEAEFLEMELQAVRETLVQKEEQLVDALHESDEVFSRFTELESKLAESEDMCQGLRTELVATREDAGSAAKERNALSLQLDSERQRLDELVHMHKKDIEQALAKVVSDHSVEVSSLQAAVAEMSQLSGSLQKQLEQAQLSSADYENRILGASNELEAAQSQISQLSAECKSLSDAKSEIAEKDLAIERLTEQLQSARIELTESNNKLEDLESRFMQQTRSLELKSAECDESALSVGQLTASIEQLAQQLAERDTQFTAEMDKAQEKLVNAKDVHIAEKQTFESLVSERAKEIGELQGTVHALSEQLKEVQGEKERLVSQLTLTSDQASTVPALVEEASKLKHEVTLLSSSGEQLKVLLSAKQVELESANTEKTHLHAKILELESQNADIWERVSELTVVSNDLNDKLAVSESAAAEHKRQALQLDTTANELAAARDSLETKLMDLSESHKLALAESECIMAQIQADLDSKISSSEKLESELRSSKESGAAASTSNEQLATRASMLESTLSDEHHKVGAILKELDALRDEYANLQADLLANKKEYEQKVSDLDSEMTIRDTQITELSAHLSKAISEHSSQIDDAKDRENAAQEDIARLEASLESMRSQLTSLQTDMAETDKNKSSIAQLNAELSEKLESKSASVVELESRVESLQISVDNARSEKDKADRMYDLAKQELADLEERVKTQIADLESAISLKSRELDNAVLAKAELAAQLQCLDAVKTEHAEHAKGLQAELEAVNNRMVEFSHDHESLVDSLRRELNDHEQRAQEQLGQTNKAAILAEESRVALQQRLNELQLSHDDVTKQLEDTEMAKADLLEKLRMQEDLAEKLSASAGNSELQIADIQESHRAAISMLEDKIGAVQAERDRLVSSLHDTTDSLDTANLEVERLQESIRALRIEHEAASKESAAAKESFENCKIELEAGMAKLQQQLSDTSTHNSQLQSKILGVEEQNMQLMPQLENANAMLEEAHALEQKLKDQVTQLELDLEDQNKLLTDTKAQLAAACTDSAEQAMALQTETKRLCAELQTNASQLDDMSQRLCKAQEEALEISSERDHLQAECNSLTERAKESQAQLEQSISELKDQLNSRSIEIQELEAALENANSAIASSQRNSNDNKQEAVKELSAQVEKLVEERDRAHSGIDTLKGMMTELARVKDQDISDLEEKLAQAEELLDTSVREGLEKDELIKKSKAIASKHGDKAEKANTKLETVLAQHAETVERLSTERGEIQLRLDAALASAEELRAQKIDVDAELTRLRDEFKDVDVELYGSLSASLQNIVKCAQSLPGCENMAEMVPSDNEALASHRKLLETARELLAAAASAATERMVSDSKAPDLAQLEHELKRLRTLNAKLEEKSKMLMDAYKHDMGELRVEEESQRQRAETLRHDLDRQIERAGELEQDLAKSQSSLREQTEQRIALEARASKITADVAVSPKTPVKPTSHTQVESSQASWIAPGVADARNTVSQKAEVARLASQRTPVKPSNKRMHLSSREVVDDLLPAKMLSPLTSSALNARANSANEDMQNEKYPPRKRTPAAGVAVAEKALDTAPVAKAEATRARSSYGDRRRIRRNQPPPRKDGLEEQAAEQCVQQ